MFSIVPKNGQTWLICGGRTFADQSMFDGAMSDLCSMKGCPDVVVHGAANGADSMADAWGQKMALRVVAVPAEWVVHGRAAGPIRNRKMLEDHRVDLVIAFPGGRGTENMIHEARLRDVQVCEVRPSQ